ncbi:MAG: imidazolonepropionase [Weeksellaceae bacterium]|nr:imidazolonepropionase [Weeksellaceae bacterium]
MSNKLYGPFAQIITMQGMPLHGALQDEQLHIVEKGGILCDKNGKIRDIGNYEAFLQSEIDTEFIRMPEETVAVPGFIDSHTHICFAGNRAADFAMRLNGKSYLEIAETGGGIWRSVMHTRQASTQQLAALTQYRADRLLQQGVTTIEVKSGYALDDVNELKMLHAIQLANDAVAADLVPTFLGAHIKPKDFEGTQQEYLDFLLEKVIPVIVEEHLCQRIDIFVEQSAFGIEESKTYLYKLKEMGFDITVHADQFTTGGSALAVELGAVSADHLEASGEQEIAILANSDTVATALPGASMGLGEPWTPARKLLDAGAILAIASDWNPGSAPMGNLLTQASVLAAYEKLSTAEVLAGITYRAAHALRLEDRGRLKEGCKADFAVFQGSHYGEILYNQGMLLPKWVVKNGQLVVGKALE